VRREIEKVYLILLSFLHKVNRCVGAIAIKNKQLVASS
jgi:hypothetical protein